MKNIMQLFISAALLLSPTVEGQQTTQPEASAPAFDFRSVVEPGMTIDGHTFTPDTIFGSVALNDQGDFAFIAHWNSPTEQEALFTARGIVARTGDVIDGHYINAIPLDAKIAINNLGQVAFEANFSEQPPDSSFRSVVRGVFLDNHLVLKPFLNPVDFDLANDGRFVSEQTEPSFFHGKGKPEKTCPLPKFPLPVRWSAAQSPRIASYRYDPPLRGRGYTADLPFLRVAIDAAYRLIYFGSDCRPLLVVIGDPDYGVTTVYTEAGLLTSINPDGYLDLFSQEEQSIHVVTDQFTRKTPSLSMNRRGQVLLSINYDGLGLVLLTPKARKLDATTR